MISSILVNNITNITELKKNPVELSKVSETCVLSNGKPCFYSLSTDRMSDLLEKENELSRLKENLKESKNLLSILIYEMKDCSVRDSIINAYDFFAEFIDDGEE